MTGFDADFVEAAVGRLGALPADAAPAWGVMRPPQLLAHLTTAVRYSTGDEPITPNEGGFFGRRIAKPLIFGGIIRLPKGAKKPKFYDAGPETGTAADLRAASLAFVDMAEAGTLPAVEHPFFGPLTTAEWSRLHRIHFEHHLRQFGINL